MVKLFYIWALLAPMFFLFAFLSTNEAQSMSAIGGMPADEERHRGVGAFRYDLNPGEKTEDAILVVNNREDSQNIVLYAADGMRSSGGGFALRQMGEDKEEVGAWIKFYPDPVPEEFQSTFEEQGESILNFCALNEEGTEEWCEGEELVELTLEGESRKEIPFTFSVPEDAEVGEHTGGILIQEAQPEDEDREGGGITLTTRIGTRVYQTVPGDIVKELKLKEFSIQKRFSEFDFSTYFDENDSENYLINTKVANKGNVSTYFNQEINIIDEFFGEKDEKIEDRRFQVLRDDVRHSNYVWESPRFGKFTFETSISYTDHDGEEHVLESEPLTIWIIPWREITIALAVIVLIIVGFRIRGAVSRKKQ